MLALITGLTEEQLQAKADQLRQRVGEQRSCYACTLDEHLRQTPCMDHEELILIEAELAYRSAHKNRKCKKIRTWQKALLIWAAATLLVTELILYFGVNHGR